MAHQPDRQLLSLLGYVYWGDIADLTVYVSKRGKLVVFAKTYPEGPPSTAQLTQRTAWRNALDAWLAKTDAYRAQWHLAARRASLCLHGLNLYLSAKLCPDDAAIATLEHQTNTTLLPT